MKKIVVIFMLCAFFNAYANPKHTYIGTWNDPFLEFDATKNFTNKIELSWIVTDNVRSDCLKEAKKRIKGFTGWQHSFEACAFWEGSKCIIFTKKNPTMHDLGHEVRHCFQGAWH